MAEQEATAADGAVVFSVVIVTARVNHHHCKRKVVPPRELHRVVDIVLDN